jgi:hypothetical protein
LASILSRLTSAAKRGKDHFNAKAKRLSLRSYPCHSRYYVRFFVENQVAEGQATERHNVEL